MIDDFFLYNMTFKKIYEEIEKMKEKNYEVRPFFFFKNWKTERSEKKKKRLKRKAEHKKKLGDLNESSCFEKDKKKSKRKKKN